MSNYHNFWKVIYKIYPPFLRILEKLKIHKGRQPYSLGTLKVNLFKEDLKLYLTSQGYEHVYLAWKDTEEVLSMRKVDNKIFQYHIRLFKDGEVRGHYEYSPEGNPIKHVLRICFEKRENHFKKLMRDYLN